MVPTQSIPRDSIRDRAHLGAGSEVRVNRCMRRRLRGYNRGAIRLRGLRAGELVGLRWDDIAIGSMCSDDWRLATGCDGDHVLSMAGRAQG